MTSETIKSLEIRSRAKSGAVAYSVTRVEFSKEYASHSIREIIEQLREPQMTPTMMMDRDDARRLILRTIDMLDDLEPFLDFLVEANCITNTAIKEVEA